MTKKILILFLIITMLSLQSFARVGEEGVLEKNSGILMGKGAGFVTSIDKEGLIITLKSKLYGPLYGCTNAQVGYRYDSSKVELIKGYGNLDAAESFVGENSEIVKFQMQPKDGFMKFAKASVGASVGYVTAGLTKISPTAQDLDASTLGEDFVEMKFRLKEGAGVTGGHIKSYFLPAGNPKAGTLFVCKAISIIPSEYSYSALIDPTIFDWDYSAIEDGSTLLPTVITDDGWNIKLAVPPSIALSPGRNREVIIYTYAYHTAHFGMAFLADNMSVKYRASHAGVQFIQRPDKKSNMQTVMVIPSDIKEESLQVEVDIIAGGHIIKTASKTIKLIAPITIQSIDIAPAPAEQTSEMVYTVRGIKEGQVVTFSPSIVQQSEKAYYVVYYNDIKLTPGIMQVTAKKGQSKVVIYATNDITGKRYTDKRIIHIVAD